MKNSNNNPVVTLLMFLGLAAFFISVMVYAKSTATPEASTRYTGTATGLNHLGL